MEQETTVHKRRPRYKGKYPKRFEENIRNCSRKIQRHDRACDQQREYSGRHAYFDHGQRDIGFPENSAG